MSARENYIRALGIKALTPLYDPAARWLFGERRFKQYAHASGGYGECVEDRAALPGALSRALRVVREERRQALLDVICA